MSVHVETRGPYGPECAHCGLRPDWPGWRYPCVPVLRRGDALAAQRVRDTARRARQTPAERAASNAAMCERMRHARAAKKTGERESA